MKTTKFLILVFLIGLMVCPLIFAQEVIVNYELDSLPVLNHELDRTRERLRAIEDDSTVDLTDEVVGILPLVNGGTGEALVDPGADRIGFWDDSEDEFTWLTPGTGLVIDTTTLSVDDSNDYENGTSYTDATAVTERSTGLTSYTKLKEFSPLTRSGNITIAWDQKSGNVGTRMYTKVYVNNVAVSGEKTNISTTYLPRSEEDLVVEAGDVIQIYGKEDGIGGGSCYVQNVKIQCTNPTIPQEVSGY